VSHAPKSKNRERIHLALLAAWVVATILAIVFGWIYSVAFVSACSLYANIAAHWGGYEAAKSATD
jgi:membrane protease YdiL (CAAX protease family)